MRRAFLPLAVALALFAAPAAGTPGGGALAAGAAAQSAASESPAERRAALELRKLEAETRYTEKYYEHLEKLNGIAADKFVWQDRASEFILWLVVLVVGGGVLLTAFQLWLAFFKGGRITDTTLEASAKSFRITSSVVGLVVLVISVGFLYLFLREVYHIEVVSVSGPGQGQDQGPAQARPQGQPGTAAVRQPMSPADFGLPEPLPEGTVILKEKPATAR